MRALTPGIEWISFHLYYTSSVTIRVNSFDWNPREKKNEKSNYKEIQKLRKIKKISIEKTYFLVSISVTFLFNTWEGLTSEKFVLIFVSLYVIRFFLKTFNSKNKKFFMKREKFYVIFIIHILKSSQTNPKNTFFFCLWKRYGLIIWG